MNLQFTWKKPRDPYATGEYLLVNDVMLGSYTWMQGVYAGYMIFSKLPGLATPNTVYDHSVDAKAALEKLITAWFERFQ